MTIRMTRRKQQQQKNTQAGDDVKIQTEDKIINQ
jgi:hypothetical protein